MPPGSAAALALLLLLIEIRRLMRRCCTRPVAGRMGPESWCFLSEYSTAGNRKVDDGSRQFLKNRRFFLLRSLQRPAFHRLQLEEQRAKGQSPAPSTKCPALGRHATEKPCSGGVVAGCPTQRHSWRGSLGLAFDRPWGALTSRLHLLRDPCSALNKMPARLLPFICVCYYN